MLKLEILQVKLNLKTLSMSIKTKLMNLKIQQVILKRSRDKHTNRKNTNDVYSNVKIETMNKKVQEMKEITIPENVSGKHLFKIIMMNKQKIVEKSNQLSIKDQGLLNENRFILIFVTLKLNLFSKNEKLNKFKSNKTSTCLRECDF